MYTFILFATVYLSTITSLEFLPQISRQSRANIGFEIGISPNKKYESKSVKAKSKSWNFTGNVGHFTSGRNKSSSRGRNFYRQKQPAHKLLKALSRKPEKNEPQQQRRVQNMKFQYSQRRLAKFVFLRHKIKPKSIRYIFYRPIVQPQWQYSLYSLLTRISATYTRDSQYAGITANGHSSASREIPSHFSYPQLFLILAPENSRSSFHLNIAFGLPLAARQVAPTGPNLLTRSFLLTREANNIFD